MTSYKITHSHGQTETAIETYEEAVTKVREVYGSDVEIGHSGDIQDGGQKTYVWQDAATAENDDGSRACCSIRRVESPPSLHDRIAAALGWTVDQVRSLSMHSLRDLVRPVDAALAAEMSGSIHSGSYIRGSRR